MLSAVLRVAYDWRDTMVPVRSQRRYAVQKSNVLVNHMTYPFMQESMCDKACETSTDMLAGGSAVPPAALASVEPRRCYRPLGSVEPLWCVDPAMCTVNQVNTHDTHQTAREQSRESHGDQG